MRYVFGICQNIEQVSACYSVTDSKRLIFKKEKELKDSQGAKQERPTAIVYSFTRLYKVFAKDVCMYVFQLF